MNTTDYLTQVLSQTNRSGLLRYEKTQLLNRVVNFDAYMDKLVERSGLPRKTIFQQADIPVKIGYKILRGEAYTADRNRLIRILLVLRPSLAEFQRAFTLHQTPGLTPLRQKDAVLIYALSHHIYDIEWVNSCLKELGETPI
ncbi:MAG: hypothetical protein K6E30_05580 [Lachnospiraceae bacterium]|nr:hypothetical protein [Lachnospiraceae bacterium]